MESPFTLGDFVPGQRVELHPATDWWMRGARYGDVVNVGRSYVRVRIDATGRVVKLHAADIGSIVS